MPLLFWLKLDFLLLLFLGVFRPRRNDSQESGLGDGLSGVAPTKSDLAVVERNQSMVRNGTAVGVTAEVLKHILRTTEWWFGVDDPMFSK